MKTEAYRQTKYCKALKEALNKLGHATNLELLRLLQNDFPDVSATTIHRATARLAGRGEIAVAPPDNDGSMRYDANTVPHDHFICNHCGVLKDTQIKDKIIPIIESSIDGCRISGQLTVAGICKLCSRRTN